MVTRSDPGGRRVGTGGVPREVRESQILRVAGEIFADQGYHGASMDGIAVRADVSKPLLYNYFGSKQGLYLAYISGAGTDLLTQLQRATERDAPPPGRLWAGVVAFFGFVDSHRAGWAVLYQEAASQGGPFAAEVAELRGEIAAMVARLLEEASDDGMAEGPSEVVASFAHAFVGAGESLANWWLAYPDIPVDDVARRLMDFAWMGLGDLIEGRTWSPDHGLADP